MSFVAEGIKKLRAVQVLQVYTYTYAPLRTSSTPLSYVSFYLATLPHHAVRLDSCTCSTTFLPQPLLATDPFTHYSQVEHSEKSRVLWRGMKNLRVPSAFMEGKRGGSEIAPMSTTKDLGVRQVSTRWGNGTVTGGGEDASGVCAGGEESKLTSHGLGVEQWVE